MTPLGARVPRAQRMRGGFQRRLGLIFGVQLVAMVAVSLMGYYHVAPVVAMVLLIVSVSTLTWVATERTWRQVRALARWVGNWKEGQSDVDSIPPARLRQIDGDIATLARGFHHFASRIAGYNERERNFTRDASHELRSPLTVIKMSVDMLSEETDLSEFGQRSVQRIRRATHEMEALIEALLILARDADHGAGEQDFVVNEVLHDELVKAREMLHGQPIQLQLEEPARFALHGSPRVFAVLCWQLIRHASQYTGQGVVQITVSPGMVSVSAMADGEQDPLAAPMQRGFEYAIAQRIGERFAWPLNLHVQGGRRYVAQIRFPKSLPVSA